MDYSEKWMELSSIKVFYRSWEASDEKAVICGIHGLGEESSRYSKLGNFLSANGFSFFIYDLRGHGKTAFNTKNFGYVDSFYSFVHDTRDFISKVIEEKSVKKVILFGHSMGGLIALHYLSRIKDYVSCGVTSGAATITKTSFLQKYLLLFVNMVKPTFRVNLPIKLEDLTHSKDVYDKYLSSYLIVKRPTVKLLYELYRGSKTVWRYLPQINIPILMMHGEADKVVPKEATVKAFEMINSNDKQLKIYPKMYHEIFNEENNQQVYSDLIEWLSVKFT